MVSKKNKARRFVFAALLAIFLTLAVVSLINIAAALLEYSRARREYDSLRQYAKAENILQSSVPNTPSQRSMDSIDSTDISLTKPSVTAGPTETPEAAAESTPPPRLSEINPDYIGWIRIEGTNIDYPLVQGEDNEKYLFTNFFGEENSAGAIFMDSRCADGFESSTLILYGHNMKDGSMFADLNRCLDEKYLAEHSEITIATPDGAELAYRITDVRVTDINDELYALIDEGEDKKILALSTCTNGANDDERLLVLAAAE